MKSPITAIFLALIAAIALWLAALAWEPQDVGRNDIAYWLAIPDHVKSIPIIEPCGEPRYSLVRRDGLSPRLARVRYATALPPAEALQRSGTALEERGCSSALDASRLWAEFCAPPLDGLQIDVTVEASISDSHCSSVAVSVIGG